MKLKVRTLQNVEVEIETSLEDTIRKLKEHIQEKFPTMDAGRQKIIHAGKILRDELQVKDYNNLRDNERLVVLLTKATKVATTASSNNGNVPTESTIPSSTPPVQSTTRASLSTALPESTALPAGENNMSNVERESEKAEAPAPGNASASLPTVTTASSQGGNAAELRYEGAASALVVGTELDEVVENIYAMGFPREQVRQALRAAFNNPDRAVEYLMTSIPVNPSHASANPVSPPSATPGTVSNNSAVPPSSLPELTSLFPLGETGSPEPGMSEGSTADFLQALRNSPQLARFRERIARDPHLLHPLLETIGTAYPGFMRAINGHEEEFARLLLDPSPSTEQQAPPAGTPATITLTLAEMDSVQRLEGLGFPRDVVLEAYVACDRNEELTANYLFENIQDLMDDGNSA